MIGGRRALAQARSVTRMRTMDATAEDLYRFGVALAIGAMIGVERQFSGTHEEDDEPTPALLPPPSDGQVRAAVAAAAEHPPVTPPAPVTPPRRQESAPAGVRTFALFALLGGATAYLAPAFPWLFSASLLVLGALVVAGYHGGLQRRSGDVGLTSEISSVITFLLGAMAVTGQVTIAGACGVVVTSLLALKRTLHAFTFHIKQEDIRAALKFAVITVVILPLLPADPLVLGDYIGRGPQAEAAGPVDPGSPEQPAAVAPVATSDAPRAGAPPAKRPWWTHLAISPRKVWYMVVLISGVSFAGYVLTQVFGTGRGLIVTGIFGGLVSSTAVSLSFSQRSKESPELSPRLAMGVLLANAIMPLRLLAVLALIDLRVALWLLLPLGAMTLTGALCALWLHLRRDRHGANVEVHLKNPFEISPALKIGAVFAVVLVLAQVVQALFGATGLYVLGVVSGLTDVDAIGLAVTNQAVDGKMLVGTAATVAALAVLSNSVLKGGFIAWFGAPHLRRLVSVAFALMLGAAVGGLVGAHALLG
jgi:uncharacterized membrane protein (DUF4010 family)